MPASIAQLEEHRAALTGHCYRLLGSAGDADDAVQESMVRAWRGLDRFDGRASMRTWLYRIATNVCIDALADRSRRARPLEDGPAGAVEDAATMVRYVEAFERYDVDTLASLLREDVTFSMPPYSLWLRGPTSVHAWLLGPGARCRGSRLVPTAACGSPAFGQYRESPTGGHRAWALVVLELSGESIADWISFLDTETFFPRFGLPLDLPA